MNTANLEGTSPDLVKPAALMRQAVALHLLLAEDDLIVIRMAVALVKVLEPLASVVEHGYGNVNIYILDGKFATAAATKSYK